MRLGLPVCHSVGFVVSLSFSRHFERNGEYIYKEVSLMYRGWSRCRE